MQKLISLFIMGFVFVSPALAQIEKGNSELSISASFQGATQSLEAEVSGETFELDIKTSQQTIIFSYGYFLSQTSEIGGSFFLIRNSSENLDEDLDDPSDPAFGWLNVFYSYHFVMDNPRSAPYVGVEVGKGFTLGWDEDDQNGASAPKETGIGLYAGIKFFVSTKTSLGPVLRLRRITVTQEFESSGETVEFTGTTSSTTLLFQVATLF